MRFRCRCQNFKYLVSKKVLKVWGHLETTKSSRDRQNKKYGPQIMTETGPHFKPYDGL